MSIDDEKLKLDRERLSFERERHAKEMELDERRFLSEKRTQHWAQLATFVPILAIIFGFFFSLHLERVKKELERHAAMQTESVRFIDRQLSELYYPLKIRIERDNAIYQISRRNKDAPKEKQLDENIERRIALPNHEEMIEILKAKFHLLVNPDEPGNVDSLIASINRYQRHVAIYVALRDTNDSRWPADLCTSCAYPMDFELAVNARIDELRKQRDKLIKAQHEAAWRPTGMLQN